MYGRRMRNIVPPIVLAALCACASPLPAVDARLPNSDARADVDAAPGRTPAAVVAPTHALR